MDVEHDMVELRRLMRFDEYRLEEYARLFADIPLFGLGPDEQRTWVEKLLDRGIVYILDAGGRLVGFHGFYANDLEGREAYGSGFVVAQEIRGTGWGKKMLNAVWDECRRCGMMAYVCNVVRDNVRVLELYARMGMVPVGPGRDDDHVLVRKELT